MLVWPRAEMIVRRDVCLNEKAIHAVGVMF
jgi:hypothetical protein